MKMKIRKPHFYLKSALSEYGWLIAASLVIVSMVVTALLINPVEEGADAVLPSDPKVPPMLADHAERAPGEPRGETVGAAPNKNIPRPSAHLEARGIEYNYYQSPNWSPRGFNQIEAITVHVTGPGTCPGMRSWFSQPQSNASAQLGVCKDGSIEQYVELADGAWHNGIVNNPDLSNSLIASWVRNNINPNSRTIGIELLLAPGENLNDYPEMRESFYVLMKWLSDELEIPLNRTHVIGHYQIDSVNRSVDPRCCVSIDTVLDDLSGGSAPNPPGQGEPVTPPDYSEECWSNIVDERWSNRWNKCNVSWIFPDGSFYIPSTDTHYHSNGVPK